MDVEPIPQPRGRGHATKPWLWEKGKSANPKGRPKDAIPSHDTVIRQARKATPEIMERLIAIATGKETAKIENVIRACEAVLNRAWGMPRQAVDVNSTAQAFVALLPAVATAEEWQRAAAELNGMKTIEHQEFEPTQVVELASADKSSYDSGCND